MTVRVYISYIRSKLRPARDTARSAHIIVCTTFRARIILFATMRAEAVVRRIFPAALGTIYLTDHWLCRGRASRLRVTCRSRSRLAVVRVHDAGICPATHTTKHSGHHDSAQDTAALRIVHCLLRCFKQFALLPSVTADLLGSLLVYCFLSNSASLCGLVHADSGNIELG